MVGHYMPQHASNTTTPEVTNVPQGDAPAGPLPEMNYKLTHIPAHSSKPCESGAHHGDGQGPEHASGRGPHRCERPAGGHGEDRFRHQPCDTPAEGEDQALPEGGHARNLGGTLFEAFIARGMFGEYRKLIDDLELECAEVSDGSINRPHAEKCNHINTAGAGHHRAEQGKARRAASSSAPRNGAHMMNLELDAGSWKVIAEARESGTVGIYRPSGHAHTTLVHRIVPRCRRRDIVWEAL